MKRCVKKVPWGIAHRHGENENREYVIPPLWGCCLKLLNIFETRMSKWQFNADDNVYYQIGISYCETPADENYETLSIFVPGAGMSMSMRIPGQGFWGLFPTCIYWFFSGWNDNRSNRTNKNKDKQEITTRVHLYINIYVRKKDKNRKGKTKCIRRCGRRIRLQRHKRQKAKSYNWKRGLEITDRLLF